MKIMEKRGRDSPRRRCMDAVKMYNGNDEWRVVVQDRDSLRRRFASVNESGCL